MKYGAASVIVNRKVIMELWRGLTTMVPRPQTSLSDFTSNQKDACRRVQWPSTAVKLTGLAHSGQFKGKTWLPYTRIAQYMESIAQFSVLLVQ